MPPTAPPAMAPILLWEELEVLLAEFGLGEFEEVVAGEKD